MTSKPELPPNSGSSLAETCLPARRCPVYTRRDSSPGLRMELENLVCDGKGKRTSGGTARRKVPMRRLGADCSVVVVKRCNSRGAQLAADKAENLAGCKSLYRQLPVFGRLAYPVRAEVTKHDMPGRKSPGCPVAICTAVGTIWGVSKLGGRNIKEYLQPSKTRTREKS